MNWTLTLFLVVAILIGTTLGGVVAGEQHECGKKGAMAVLICEV
jgi:hypothetical protein